jgi:hypothetical protein
LEPKDRIQFATGSQTKVEVQWDRIHTMVFLELETRLVHRQLKILRLELRYQNEMQVDSCAAIIVIILYFVLNVISTDANKTEQKAKNRPPVIGAVISNSLIQCPSKSCAIDCTVS